MLVGHAYRVFAHKENRAAIAVYLAVCMFVYGLFGFGFYKMFQPLQFPNPGLAAYKPPPATVITYAATAKLIYGEPAPSETATEEPSHGAPDEATRAYASATPLVTAAIPVAHMPVPHVKREAATRPARGESASSSFAASGADRLVQGSFRATQRRRCLSRRICGGPMSPCPSLVALLVLCGSGNRAARHAIIAFVGWGWGQRGGLQHVRL